MRINVLFPAWNRGLVSPKALGRVDIDRIRLSAEVYNNWLPKTQGAMTVRPGTKYFGSSLNDTGAEFIEFVASTDDVGLVELTKNKMRLWLGDDAHNLALLSRPKVDTTVSLDDTGWVDASTGGAISTVSGSSEVDYIPPMTGPTTGGVTMAASGELAGEEAWKAADRDNTTNWFSASAAMPQWLRIDFGTPRRIKRYSIRAGSASGDLDNAPMNWTLQGNDVDTGVGWTTEDTRSGEIGWSVSEKRTYTDTGYTDTGANAWRYWRLNVTAVNGSGRAGIAEIELLNDTGGSGAGVPGGGLRLNACAMGALARFGKTREAGITI